MSEHRKGSRKLALAKATCEIREFRFWRVSDDPYSHPSILLCSANGNKELVTTSVYMTVLDTFSRWFILRCYFS